MNSGADKRRFSSTFSHLDKRWLLFTFNVRSLISQAAPPLTVNYTRNTMPLFCGAKNVPEVIHKKCYVFNLAVAVYAFPKSLTSGRGLLCLVHGNEKVKVISSRVSCNNVVSPPSCVYTVHRAHFFRPPFQIGSLASHRARKKKRKKKKKKFASGMTRFGLSFGRVSNYRKNLLSSWLKFTSGSKSLLFRCNRIFGTGTIISRWSNFTLIHLLRRVKRDRRKEIESETVNYPGNASFLGSRKFFRRISKPKDLGWLDSSGVLKLVSRLHKGTA